MPEENQPNLPSRRPEMSVEGAGPCFVEVKFVDEHNRPIPHKFSCATWFFRPDKQRVRAERQGDTDNYAVHASGTVVFRPEPAELERQGCCGIEGTAQAVYFDCLPGRHRCVYFPVTAARYGEFAFTALETGASEKKMPLSNVLIIMKRVGEPAGAVMSSVRTDACGKASSGLLPVGLYCVSVEPAPGCELEGGGRDAHYQLCGSRAMEVCFEFKRIETCVRVVVVDLCNRPIEDAKVSACLEAGSHRGHQVAGTTKEHGVVYLCGLQPGRQRLAVANATGEVLPITPSILELQRGENVALIRAGKAAPQGHATVNAKIVLASGATPTGSVTLVSTGADGAETVIGQGTIDATGKVSLLIAQPADPASFMRTTFLVYRSNRIPLSAAAAQLTPAPPGPTVEVPATLTATA